MAQKRRWKQGCCLLGVLAISLLTGFPATADDQTGRPQPDPTDPARFRAALTQGSLEDKEAALLAFMAQPDGQLVDDVIQALQDETRLPRHGDTGWASVHHLAAWALGTYACTLDGQTIAQRGRSAYTFYDDGGIAGPEKRALVQRHWREWWRTYRQAGECP